MQPVYVNRYSPPLKRVASGVHQHHVVGESPEIVEEKRFATKPPSETEGDYKNQAGLGEQGSEQINAGNGNPKSTGEAATSSPGRGPSMHKSRLTEGR